MPTPAAIRARHAALYDGLPVEPIPRIAPTDLHRTLVSNSSRDLGAGYPFIASLASSDSLAYHAVEHPAIPVAATDGAAIYLNAVNGGWLDPKAYDQDERVFIHAHEVLHVMREDVYKQMVWKQQGWVPVPRLNPYTGVGNPEGRLPFDGEVVGKTLDAIINATLIADRLGKCPPDAVRHPLIGPECDDGTGYWHMWTQVQEARQGRPKPGLTLPGQGQGAGRAGTPQPGQGPSGGPPRAGNGMPNRPEPGATQGDLMQPGSMGDPGGDTSAEASQPQGTGEALAALAAGMAERAVAVARAVGVAREAGQQSSYAEAMVRRSRAPGIDWRSYFQGWLARAAGNTAYDWRRAWKPAADRKLVGQKGYFAPARGGHGMNCMVYAGDVSGSISPAEHRVILGTLCEMAEELNPASILVLWIDTRVLRADWFDGAPPGDELDSYYAANPIPQGGGTRFHPAFAVVDAMATSDHAELIHLLGERTHPEVALRAADVGLPDGLCYVTDLHGRAPDEPPANLRVLWLSTTTQPHPWGERLDLDVASLVDA